jgi:hypothetical protein
LPREEDDALHFAQGDHGFGGAVPDVVAILDRDHLADGLGDRQLFGTDVGHTDVTDLADTLELSEGTDSVLVGNAGIGDVHLVDVDGVDAQATKALLALLADVIGLPERRQARLARGDLARLDPALVVISRSSGYGWRASAMTSSDSP